MILFCLIVVFFIVGCAFVLLANIVLAHCSYKIMLLFLLFLHCFHFSCVVVALLTLLQFFSLFMCCCITLLMLLFHSSHVDASFFMCCYLDSSSIATSNILALLPHSFFTLFLLSFCACAFVFIMLLLLLFFLRCYFILFTIQVHTDPSRSCFFRNITFVFFALFCSCFFR